MLLKKLVLALFLSLFLLSSQALENLVYTLRQLSPSDFQTLTKNADIIQILSPQSYVIYPTGNIKEHLNPDIVTFAHQHKIKLMPFITIPENGEEKVHKFLNNKNETEKVIHFLLDTCQKNHLYGVQLDFENIWYEDRKALTRFYQNLAEVLHQHGFAISIAIIPRLRDHAGDSLYLQHRFKRYTGVYDYVTLGKISDFVVLLAYDQHIDGTTPGPTSTYRWSEQIIQYALKYIPADKIFLGVPTYSTYWRTMPTDHASIRAVGQQIDFDTAQEIIHRFNPDLHWDHTQKINYAFYVHDELNEFLFLENINSMAAKLNLAFQYKLRGIAIYRLGTEDPKIWNLIKNPSLRYYTNHPLPKPERKRRLLA